MNRKAPEEVEIEKDEGPAVDYLKAYDMLSHFHILASLNLIKISKIYCVIMKGWKTYVDWNGENLGETRLRQGGRRYKVIHCHLFVVAIIPLTMLLRREAIENR